MRNKRNLSKKLPSVFCRLATAPPSGSEKRLRCERCGVLLMWFSSGCNFKRLWNNLSSYIDALNSPSPASRQWDHHSLVAAGSPLGGTTCAKAIDQRRMNGTLRWFVFKGCPLSPVPRKAVSTRAAVLATDYRGPPCRTQWNSFCALPDFYFWSQPREGRFQGWTWLRGVWK